MRPILFYTVGYPGAGKTTLARSLSQWLNTTYLRGDKIGFELFPFPTYSLSERQAVHAEMQRRSSQSLLNGKHVLYDAATNTRAQREQLIALARQHGAQAVGLWVEVPTRLAKQRAARVRDRGLAGPIARVIPPHIFDQYVAAFEVPSQNEYTIRINGDVSFFLQYRHLRRQLRMPELKLPQII